MGYDTSTWLKRIRSRSDMSSYVTHLTREHPDLNLKTSLDTLIKILKEKNLIGSTNTGFISGSERAVCFQDAPLHGITQNLIHEQNNMEQLGGKVRYKPVGICFSKTYAFKKGARPVIYEDRETAKKKFSNELWRVVTFDLSDKDKIIDWTHEREWRLKGDFTFDLQFATLLVPHRKAYLKLIERLKAEDLLDKIGGIIVLDPILT